MRETGRQTELKMCDVAFMTAPRKAGQLTFRVMLNCLILVQP